MASKRQPKHFDYAKAPTPIAGIEQPTVKGKIDVAGLAVLVEERAGRYASAFANDDLSACVRLLMRNKELASAVRQVIEQQMTLLPGGGRGLDSPLFGPDGVMRQ